MAAHLQMSEADQVVALIRRALHGEELELLATQELDAQHILDTLHQILDTSSFNVFPDVHANQVQHRLRRILLKLALHCRSVPSQLILRNEEWTSLENRGGGAFADIYRGEYGGKRVAVKRLRIFQVADVAAKTTLTNSIYHESLLWRHLSHPHILPFLGIADTIFQGSLCMVMPWSEHGNIRDVIHDWKENVNSSIQDLFMRVHQWIIEIASGLTYLHGEDVNIAHGDLRAVNILIDADWKVRLADFGLAVFAGESSNHYASARGGASHWLAPEIIDPEAFGLSSSRPTFAADVYSFACVCIELYTSQAPFAGWNPMTVLLHVLRGGKPARPAFHQTEEMSEKLYALLSRCWNESWAERPTARDVLQSLSTLVPLLLGRQCGVPDPRGGEKKVTIKLEPATNPRPRRNQSLNDHDQLSPVLDTRVEYPAIEEEAVIIQSITQSPVMSNVQNLELFAESSTHLIEPSSGDTDIPRTGAWKAAGNINSFAKDVSWIINGLSDAESCHPAIIVATISFRVAINMEMARRQNDTRVRYIYTEMKDTVAVLLQLKVVKDPRSEGPDGVSLETRLSPICEQLATNIKSCANVCDAFVKQQPLLRVLKGPDWHDQLLSYVAIFAERRAELQMVIAKNIANSADEVNATINASELASTSINQRMLQFSELLKANTPSNEQQLQQIINTHGGLGVVKQSEAALRQLIGAQDFEASVGQVPKFVRLTSSMDVKTALYQRCDDLISQNMVLFDSKFNLVQQGVQQDIERTISEASDGIIAAISPGPHSRIRDSHLRKLWKEMGWRMSVKSSHFLRAVHDFFQEAQDSEGGIESPEEWAYQYLDDRWHPSILDAIDDDHTGYITISKLNRFTGACLPGWRCALTFSNFCDASEVFHSMNDTNSLLRWLAYWAVGWEHTAQMYCTKIQDICSEMYDILPSLLPRNRRQADLYLYDTWQFVAELTLSVHPSQADTSSEFAEYVEREEEHIKRNLHIVHFDIDALDTLYAITGSGRIEYKILPMIYLLLNRDLQIFRLARSHALDPKEFTDAATNLRWASEAVRYRVNDLTDLCKQKNLDPKWLFKKLACGIFEYTNDSDSLWSMSTLDRSLPPERIFSTSTVPESVDTGTAVLKYPIKDLEQLFAFDAFNDLGSGKQGVLSLETGPVEEIQGQWHGYIYNDTEYPFEPMTAYTFNATSADTFSAAGRDPSLGSYTLSGHLEKQRDGSVGVNFQVTYEGVSGTEYFVGQLGDDGSIEARSSWTEGQMDTAEDRTILRRVSPDVMRFRPTPMEMRNSALRPRALWRFAMDFILHKVRRARWSWSYFAERAEIRKQYIKLNIAYISAGSLSTKDEYTELAACRRALSPSEAIYYKSIQDHVIAVSTKHHGIICDSCDRSLDDLRFLCLDCVSPERKLWETRDACSLKCFSQPVPKANSLHHTSSHNLLKLRAMLHMRDLPRIYRLAMEAIRRSGTLEQEILNPSFEIWYKCAVCRESINLPCWRCIYCPDYFLCDACEENNRRTRCRLCLEPYTPPLWSYGYGINDLFTCSKCSLVRNSVQHSPTDHTYMHPVVRVKVDSTKDHNNAAGRTDSQLVVATVPTLEGKVAEMDSKLNNLTNRFGKVEETLGSIEQMLRALMTRSGTQTQ